MFELNEDQIKLVSGAGGWSEENRPPVTGGGGCNEENRPPSTGGGYQGQGEEYYYR